jgi:probable rRNA maturation factor
VIAFRLPHVDQLAADIYICPSVARRSARDAGVTEREEMVRLVVHGVLHVLGQEHPDGTGRTRSVMWRHQERYVEQLSRRAPR